MVGAFVVGECDDRSLCRDLIVPSETEGKGRESGSR